MSLYLLLGLCASGALYYLFFREKPKDETSAPDDELLTPSDEVDEADKPEVSAEPVAVLPPPQVPGTTLVVTDDPSVPPTFPAGLTFEKGYTASQVRDLMMERLVQNSRTGEDIPFPAYGVIVSCKKDIGSEADKWLSSAGLTNYRSKAVLKGPRTPEEMLDAVRALLPELKRRGAKRLILFYYGPVSALPTIVALLLTVADVQLMEYDPRKGYRPSFAHIRP